MLIREANHSDASSIARVQVAAWQTTYKGIVPDNYLASYTDEKRAERWQQILASQANQKSNFTFVAETEDKQIVGFASAGETEDAIEGFSGELIAIYLLTNHRRRGTGKLLVKAVAERFSRQRITSMLVWVLADNPFRVFYESLGGERVSEKQMKIGDASLRAVSYGWKNLDVLLEK